MFSLLKTAAVALPTVALAGPGVLLQDEVAQQRLMRQEMKAAADTAASEIEAEEEDDDVGAVSALPTPGHVIKRQHRKAGNAGALLAGDSTPLGITEGEDESDKDKETQDSVENCPQHYIITGAEKKQPLRMGVFWRVPGSRLPLWQNTHQEYLFFSPKYLEWRIGTDYKKPEAGLASTPNEYSHCPDKATSWYVFSKGNWSTKYKINVEPEECPIEMWVKGAEVTQPYKMGPFYITLNQLAGRPIYENEHHMFLYYWPTFGEWRIGSDWKKPEAGVASKRGEYLQCPHKASSWSLFSSNSWTEAPGLSVSSEKNGTSNSTSA